MGELKENRTVEYRPHKGDGSDRERGVVKRNQKIAKSEVQQHRRNIVAIVRLRESMCQRRPTSPASNVQLYFTVEYQLSVVEQRSH